MSRPFRFYVLELCVAVLLALGLAGSFASAAAKKTELSFVMWQDEKAAPIWEEIFRGFETEHPDITIKPIVNKDEYLSKLLVMMSGGTAIDLVMIDYVFAPTLMTSGYLTALDSYMARDNYGVRNLFPGSLQALNYQGKQFGIPMDMNNQGMFYNRTLLDSAGLTYPDETWTWATFLNAAKKLSRDINKDGQNEQWGYRMSLYWEPVAPWVWNAGGDYFNEDHTLVTLDQPAAVDGMQFIGDMMNVHHVMPSWGGEASLFTGQQVGMFGGGYWEISFLRSVSTLDWDVAPLPYKITQGGKPYRQSTLGGVHIGIPSSSKNKDAAWEFIKYRLRKEVQLRSASLGLSMPATREAATAPEFLNQDKPAHLRYFVEALGYTRPFSSFPGFENVDATAISPQLEKVWEGSASAKLAMEAAAKQGNAMLKGMKPYKP